MPVELTKGDYKVLFLPERGMNFVSFKRGEIQVIDESTRALFEERSAGLGAMIGPHFHHRATLPEVEIDDQLFPHAKKSAEPFSHGIGRYVPWRIKKADGCSLSATLSGKDKVGEVYLKDLEGQDFRMSYDATLSEEGLQIELSVESEKESIVGLHTYYAIEESSARVLAEVQNIYNDKGEFKPIPSHWNYKDHRLTFSLNQAADFGFLPFPNKLEGDVILKTKKYDLRVHYWSETEENSWQLWHPSGSSFVCIEPLSAKNPRGCREKSSRIKILISIL